MRVSRRAACSVRSSAISWQDLAATSILILGSPRSGTTWLAKIFDSHPSILYRHEPDECMAETPMLAPAEQLAVWLSQRGLRCAGKRPNFRKSWRHPALEPARRAAAAVLAGAERLALVGKWATGLGLPDFIPPHRWNAVRAAIKLVNWDATAVAASMPGVRCAFILRHPCGVVASVLAGQAAQRFGQAADEAQMWLPAMNLAHRRAGLDPSAFAHLPQAARLAWNWLAFNEPALHGLADRSNASIVLYEDLCRAPEAAARSLFAFAGLDWHQQTAAFLADSTRRDRGAGYFDVFRAGADVADRWQQTLTARDQDAVRGVVARSPLAACWPGLT